MSAKILCLALLGLALVQIGSCQVQGQPRYPNQQPAILVRPSVDPNAVAKSEESFIWTLIMMPLRIVRSIFSAIFSIFSWQSTSYQEVSENGHGYRDETVRTSDGQLINRRVHF